MCTPTRQHIPEVRMRFNAQRDGSVVDLQIETSRASLVVDAVMDAARDLNAVIERLELRPHHDTLDAQFFVASDQGALNAYEQQALMGAVLEAARPTVAITRNAA